MRPIDLPQVPTPQNNYLFSEEEIQNISDLLVVLKKIRMRLKSEGVDIDKITKENGIRTPFDK